MEKFPQDLQDVDVRSAMELANSDAAKQLFALLQTSDAQALNNAMEQAASGNLTGAKQVLQTMLQSEDARRLLRQLQGG